MGVSTKAEWLRSHQDRIRQRAYGIWEEEGRPEGRHGAHWDQACQECADEDARADQPAATGTKGGLVDAASATIAAVAMIGPGEPDDAGHRATRRRSKTASGSEPTD